METVNDMRDELVRWYGLDAGFVQAQSDESVELLYAEQYAYEQMKDGRIK